jgi:bifunctional non-homologous end joining protein LigD
VSARTHTLGIDGVPDFNALHSHKHDGEVQLYAFDILALDGDDLRDLPLSLRKTNLARLLARCPEGIFVAPFGQGENGEPPCAKAEVARTAARKSRPA